MGPGTGTVRLRVDALAPVLAVAVSPDGREVATADQAGRVTTFDATGGRRRVFKGPGSPLGSVAYSPDGSRIAAGVGQVARRNANPVGRFLPADGRRPGTVVLWDARTGADVAKLAAHPPFALGVAFSPDSKTLAPCGADSACKLWDAATGAARRAIDTGQTVAFAVAFAPDGRVLATAGWDGTVRVWDAATGRPKRVLAAGPMPVLSPGFAPSGEVLAGGVDRVVRRWDGVSGREVGRVVGHTAPVAALAVGPGGRTLYTGGWDGDVHRWPGDQPQESHVLARDGPAGRARTYHVCFSPDGKLLAASAFEVALYDPAARRLVRTLDVGDSDLIAAFRPDGKELVAAGSRGVVYRWDPATGTARPPLTGHGTKIWSLGYSPDGRTLATGADMWGRPGELRLWDAVTGKLRSKPDPTAKEVRALRYAPDGRTLLSAGGWSRAGSTRRPAPTSRRGRTPESSPCRRTARRRPPGRRGRTAGGG